MLLFRNSRKVHPILSSLTSTHPSTVEGCVDVDRNLVSSLFLEFLNSFVNGKLVKTSTKSFRRPSDKCQEGALAPKCDQATTKKSTGSHHHMVRPAFPPSVEVQPSFCSFWPSTWCSYVIIQKRSLLPLWRTVVKGGSVERKFIFLVLHWLGRARWRL